MDKSSYSSFYSSFLRTEGSSTEERPDADNSVSNHKHTTSMVRKFKQVKVLKLQLARFSLYYCLFLGIESIKTKNTTAAVMA